MTAAGKDSAGKKALQQMNGKLTVICPQEAGKEYGHTRLAAVLEEALRGTAAVQKPDAVILRTAAECRDYFRDGSRSGQGEEADETGCRRRLLFAVELGEDGINLEFEKLLRVLRADKGILDGCTGGVLIDAASPFYTKAEASRLAQAANAAGCAFPGKCLVEGTGDLSNFTVEAANRGLSREDAYRACAGELVQTILNAAHGGKETASLLVLHASSHETSNTYALWKEIREKLPAERIRIREIGLRNGFLQDCSGCPYRMCLHFGERDSCFYGGVMVEDVYPAIREADAILMICPNYNDALSANLVAFINRLTALYRAASFREKAMFAVIVSGYSGNDIIARQLICALNMNKGFFVPPRFALMETANAPGEALRLPGIVERTEDFAAKIRGILLT